MKAGDLNRKRFGYSNSDMVRTHGLTHIALAVVDAERSLRFYKKIFGVKMIYRNFGFIQAQTPGSRDVLVFEENAPRRGKPGGCCELRCPGWSAGSRSVRACENYLGDSREWRQAGSVLNPSS